MAEVNMTLQFTNFEAISRRLAGRLELAEVHGVAPPWGNNMGGKAADPETVRQIAEQKETLVRNILRMVYKFPLQLAEEDTRRTLAEIVEKLVVADVLDIYFQGSSVPAPGTEISGLAAGDRKSAYELLHLYTAGHGIPIPQIPYIQQSPGVPAQQGILLPGESPNPTLPDHLSRNYTVVGKVNRPGYIDFSDGALSGNRPPDSLRYEDFNRYSS